MLTGITEDGTDTDIIASRSWIYPTIPVKVSGPFAFDQYDFSQRAYIFNYKGKGESIGLSFNGSLYDHAFVLKNIALQILISLE